MTQHPALRFYNPWADTEAWRNRLPHWQQAGVAYFITFRLADSLSAALLESWKEAHDTWMAAHPQPWTPELEQAYHRQFSAQIDEWLDAGHGACVLRDSACAEEVSRVFAHDEDKTCRFVSWVIMPNHVHAVVALAPHTHLAETVAVWKGVSARHINARLAQTGKLWQRDYFDRLIRNETHLARCVRYIRNNPIKANLHPGEFRLFESDLAQAIS